jgi:hypothetical protein
MEFDIEISLIYGVFHKKIEYLFIVELFMKKRHSFIVLLQSIIFIGI